MLSSQSTSIRGIVSTLIVLIVIGLVAYAVITKQTGTKSAKYSSDSTSTTSKKFSSAAFKFSVELPQGWEVIEETTENRYINFISPETKQMVIQNTQACADNNDATECSPEMIAADVTFQPVTGGSAAETKPVTAGAFTWTRTEYIGSLYGEPDYVMKFPDGKFYSFTVYANENVFLEMLKTFQPL